jgi:hypothetical protein
MEAHMNNDLSHLPGAVAHLHDVVRRSDTEPAELLLALRALQRMGLSAADLRVHVERVRAGNEATDNDPLVEDCAILALEMISGRLSPTYSLSWDASELARIHMPKIIDAHLLTRVSLPALTPNNLLPPRSIGAEQLEMPPAVADQLYANLNKYELAPQRADFFRVPKSGLTSRPAALLAPVDRVLYEALAEPLADLLAQSLPAEVVWPRSRNEGPSYSQFAQLPREWQSRYVVVADIESFYECVDHLVLAHFASRHIKKRSYAIAVESFLNSVMGTSSGLPQGPAASDLFASAYLAPADSILRDEGWLFARYADDYLIGASSVVEGRRKLQHLEAMLREVNLRLNSGKTKILRRSTYLEGLDQPNRRIETLRSKLRDVMIEQLRSTEDPDVAEAILREAGVGEEVLFDLLYHGTLNIDEVIAQVGDRLRPPLLDAYAIYFERSAHLLQKGKVPDDLSSHESDLRTCLLYLAGGRREVDLATIDVVLKWFPRIAPLVAAYLLSVRPSDDVADFVARRVNRPAEMDWVTSWLCYVAEAAPGLVGDKLYNALRRLARSSKYGWLSRSGAVRALASARRLDGSTWNLVIQDASSAMRAELIFARAASPDIYPVGTPAIGWSGLLG